MAQFSAPTGDVSTGSFVSAGGGTLAGQVNEDPPNDFSYIQSSVGNSSDVCRMTMGGLTSPADNNNHFLRARCRRSSGAGGWAEFKLYNSVGTLVATKTTNGVISSSFATFDLALTSTEAANLGVSGFQVEVVKNNNGFNMQVEVSYLRLFAADIRFVVSPASTTGSPSVPAPTLKLKVLPGSTTGSPSVPAPSIRSKVSPGSTTGSPSVPGPAAIRLKVLPGSTTGTPAVPAPTVIGPYQTVSPAPVLGSSSVPPVEALRLKVSPSPVTAGAARIGRPTLSKAGDDFAQVAAHPFAEVFVAADLRPREPETGSLRRFLVTNAPRLHTEPTDDPPNAIHRAVLVKGWTTSRRLSEPGKFLGSSTYNVGTLLFDNSNGAITSWLDLDWNDAPIVLKLGGRTRTDGRAFPYSRYYPYFVGVADDIRPVGDAMIELTIVGRKKVLDQQIVESIYGGFGGAVEIPQGGRLVGADEVPVVDVAETGYSIEWFGTVDALPNWETGSMEGALFSISHVVAGDDWLALYKAGLKLTSSLDGGRLWVFWNSFDTPTSYSPPVGERLHIALSVLGTTATVYAGVEGGPLELVAELLGMLAETPSLGGTVEVGTIDGFSGAALSPAEIRVWKRSRTEDELVARGGGPLLSADEEEDLLDLWKFEDGTGGIALSEVEGVDLNLEGGAAFASAYDGDDPEAFGGGPIGQTKPDGWGRARNVRLVNVDSQRHAQMWGRAPSADLERLYLGGSPMVPDEELVVGLLGEAVFEAATKTIVLSGPLKGGRFVPSQTDPERAGQRLQITGTASNNGTKTIAAEGIFDGGRRIIVEEALVQETAPPGAKIRSLAADVQYTYDLSRSAILTPADVAGDLTADVLLRLSENGTATLSEAFEWVVGQSVDKTSLAWDPEVGFWLAPGAALTRRAVLDKIVASGFAWWVEDRRGGYRLGTWRLPSGNPKARIGASKIAAIAAVPTITPYSRFRVGYDQTWHVQDRSALVGSVSSGRRQLLGEKWRLAPRTAPKRLRDKYPLAKERPELFETYLVRPRDAELFADLAQPFYLEKRRWFDVDVSGLGLLALDLDDVVWVQHPDPNHRLTDGALARILAMEEDSSSDLVSIEVFL